ncbi:kinase-like protein [Aspergillus phoenicis ATCC 13157]|uniref:non-specific serine/threonine protein kinase n=1 Tax=Aspergillus phoenicis ATCC 13157 TaxID=1353007 RepID=A0A370PLS5_ASPPH|nr:kinase-like protein [Aspergillus phoenicis ATCC 13157]
MPFKILLKATRSPETSPSTFKSRLEAHIALVKHLTGPDFPLSHRRSYIHRPTNPSPEGTYPTTVLLGQQSDFSFDSIAELTFENEAAFERFQAKVREPEIAKLIQEDEKGWSDRGKLGIVVLGETGHDNLPHQHYYSSIIMTRYSMLPILRIIRKPPQWPLLRHSSPVHRVKPPIHSPAARHNASYSTTPHPQYQLPKYTPIDDTEYLDRYEPGGYHPIMIGDVLHSRYTIVDKLGYGGYSTVWLARDTKLDRYVALKVLISDTTCNEVRVLRELSTANTSVHHPGRDSIPVPLDEFTVTGPNGTHTCYTMLPARSNLREVSYSRLFPVDVARALCGRLVLGVAYLHSQGYVHGDIHLRNILSALPQSLDNLSIEEFYTEYGNPEIYPITLFDGSTSTLSPNVPPKAVSTLFLGIYAGEFTPQDTRILLCDFGETFSPSVNPRLGEDCHTPMAFCPPEAIFEPKAPLSYSADVWSLATAIWEILGMKVVFSTDVPYDEVIAHWMDVLGPMPWEWFEKWDERGRFFDESRRAVEGRNGGYFGVDAGDAEVQAGGEADGGGGAAVGVDGKVGDTGL